MNISKSGFNYSKMAFGQPSMNAGTLSIAHILTRPTIV